MWRVSSTCSSGSLSRGARLCTAQTHTQTSTQSNYEVAVVHSKCSCRSRNANNELANGTEQNGMERGMALDGGTQCALFVQPDASSSCSSSSNSNCNGSWQRLSERVRYDYDTLITDYRLPITDYGSWLTDQQSKQEDLLSCPFIMVWLGQMYCDLVDLLFALLSLELVILRMSFYLVQFTLNRSFPFNINLKS